MASLRERRAALLAADEALAENDRLELAMGVQGETPAFSRLNRAVCEALDALPWWARVLWGGDWRWFLRHPRREIVVAGVIRKES
jgi:hypothetical protein